MRTRRLIVIGAIAATGLIVGCSSTSSTSTTTTSTTTTTAASTPKDFAVDTPDGQVSLSLDGKLPPNWPKGFPVPSGATAAGSGSAGGTSSTTMVAVYTTSGSAEDAFNFYKTNSSLTVSDASGAGVGKAFIGKLKVSGEYDGSVTVVGRADSTYIVIVLKSPGAGSNGTVAGTTPGTTAGTTPGTTKGTTVTP